MPYRAPFQPRSDPEPAAAAELRRRVHRIRLTSVIVCTALMLALMLPAVSLVTDTTLGVVIFEVRAVVICASFSIIGAFVGGLFLSQGIVQRRLDRWLDEVSARHGVPRGDLIKYTTPWR